MKREKLKAVLYNSKGITLIALIITIIVMLILAAVAINMAVNGGLFSYAAKAGEETEAARDEEQKWASGLIDNKSMEEYITGVKPVSNPYKDKEWVSAWAVVNDAWTEEIKKEEDIPQDARIVAKMYQTTSSSGCNTIAHYQIAIEGQGDMPNFEEGYTIAWRKNSNNILSLEEVYICDGITSIGEHAFRGSAALKVLEIPYTVTKIGSYSFYITGLEDIKLTNYITSIGEEAFEGCGFKQVIIPENIKTIGTGAFTNCASLIEFIVSGNNTNYSSIEGVLFDKNKTTLIAYPAKKDVENYIIPDGVTTVLENAFYNNNSLKSITIPDGVTSIGRFVMCDNFTTAYITQNGVDNYKNYNISAKNIVLDENVTYIGDGAFAYRGMQTISLPEGITSIGYRAFWFCSSLYEVILPTSINSLGEEIFYRLCIT